MILRRLALLAALVPYAFADVEFTSPAAGDSISGTAISIKWKESGDSPSISELASYQIFLCAGGNSDSEFIPLATLVTTGDFTEGNSATGSFTAGIGADVTNAYFLKIVSAATGGVVINYSDRFSLSSMDGVFPASVTTGLATVSGTSGPATENDISSPQNGGAAAGTVAAGEGAYGTPYTMQTGAIRYAPMPPMAQTKITAKNRSPQYPTSAYTTYAQVAGSPDAQTTQTQAITFSTSSMENTVGAAGQPTDAAMQRFLNRWKD